MLRFKLLAAIASCAVLVSATATADDHGRGHGDGRNWNNRGDWHQSDGHWTGNRWSNNGYGYWNNARYVPVARPVYVAPRGYGGGLSGVATTILRHRCTTDRPWHRSIRTTPITGATTSPA